MRAFTLGSGLGGLAITGITVVITVVTMGVILMATPTILTGTGIRITETTADTGTRAITVDTAAGATAVIMAVGVVTQGSDAAVVVVVVAAIARPPTLPVVADTAGNGIPRRAEVGPPFLFWG